MKEVQITEREREAFDAALASYHRPGSPLGEPVTISDAERALMFRTADSIIRAVTMKVPNGRAEIAALIQSMVNVPPGPLTAGLQLQGFDPRFTQAADALCASACVHGVGVVLVLKAGPDIVTVGKACKHCDDDTRTFIPRLLDGIRRSLLPADDAAPPSHEVH